MRHFLLFAMMLGLATIMEGQIEVKGGKIGVGTTAPQKDVHINSQELLVTDSSGTRTKMYLDPLGMIGLGTVTPQHPLHLKHSTKTLAKFGRQETGGVDAEIVIQGARNAATSAEVASLSLNNFDNNENDGEEYTMARVTGGMESTSGNKGYLKLSTNSGNNLTEKMRITSDGMVGIGTTTPTKELDVSGTLKATALQITEGANNGYLLQSDSDGNTTWINPSTLQTDPDHLGNHTATQNINLNGQWISGNGSGDGISVSTTGNVGIGTASPSKKLDVDGVVKADKIQLTDGSGAGLILVSDINGNASWQSPITVEGTSDNLGDHTASQNMRLNNNWISNDGGEEGIAIHDNGNVGIGTATPSTKLEVAGITKTTNLQITTNAGAGKVLQSDASGNATWVDASTIQSAPDNMGDHTASQNINMTDHEVRGAGKIGIGTSSPSSDLHIKGSSSTVIRLEADTDNVTETDQPKIEFSQDGGAVEGHIGFTDGTNHFRIANDYNSGDADIDIQTSGETRMTIDGTGKVGIGTTSPTQKLDVAGITKTSNLQITSGAGAGKVLQSDASGNATWVNASTLQTEPDDLGNHTATQNIKLNGKWLSNDGGNEGIKIGSTGNVGIGYGSPAYKLDVYTSKSGNRTEYNARYQNINTQAQLSANRTHAALLVTNEERDVVGDYTSGTRLTSRGAQFITKLNGTSKTYFAQGGYTGAEYRASGGVNNMTGQYSISSLGTGASGEVKNMHGSYSYTSIGNYGAKVNNANASYNYLRNNNSNKLNSAVGSNSFLYNYTSAGDIDNAYGSKSYLLNNTNAGGTITNAYGVHAYILNNKATSHITNSYGVYARINNANSGTSSHAKLFYGRMDGRHGTEYGLYLDDVHTEGNGSHITMKHFIEGNVGIGEVNPTAALHLVGNLKLASYTDTNFEGSPLSLLGVDQNGNVVKTSTDSLNNNIYNNNGTLSNSRKLSLAGNNLRFSDANNSTGAVSFEAMGSSTGSVGITSPSGSPGIVMHANNGNKANFVRLDSGLGIGVVGSSSNPGISNLFIQNNGNVGIGTSSPTTKLAVNGHIHSSGILELGHNKSGNKYSYIDLRGDDTYTDFGLRILRGNSGPNTWSEISHRGSGTLVFSAKDNGRIVVSTNNQERLITKPDGQLQIPAYTNTNFEIPSTASLSNYKQLYVDIEGNIVVGESEASISNLANEKNENKVNTLLEKITTQQELIQNQGDLIEELLERVNSLEDKEQAISQVVTVQLENSIELETPYISQNIPNPTKFQAKIRYFIPEYANNATIRFFSLSGQIMKDININQRGQGEINLEMGNIMSGNYIYTLIIDGKVIDSKTMSITN